MPLSSSGRRASTRICRAATSFGSAGAGFIRTAARNEERPTTLRNVKDTEEHIVICVYSRMHSKTRAVIVDYNNAGIVDGDDVNSGS